MMDTIKRVLAPPVFPGDEEKTRRASFLNELIGINLLVAVLIAAAVFLGNNVSTRSQIIAMSWLVVLALAWRILHSGRISFIAFALSILGFVFLTGANISLGTVRTPTAAFYVIWIIVVGVLFHLPGILMATSASSLAALGLILAENAGLLPQPNYSVGVTQWLNYTAVFGMTAGMVYYGNRITRNALVRAKNEIEQRKRAEEAAEASALQIKQAEALLRTAVETINEAFVIFDSNDCLVFCNERYRQVYAESAHLMVPGVSFETLIRNSAKQGRYLTASGRVEEWVSERLEAHRASVGTPIMEKHANGDTLHTVERRTPDGYIVGFRVDVTELQQAKQELQEKHDELERIARYDSLTKLPNRALLGERLEQALNQTRRRGQQLAVVFIDLDGFKAVNDTHGHEAGDHLLITLAERMKGALRDGDILARLGGDEFVAVLLDLADVDASAPMLNRLLDAAARPFQFGQARLQVTASLGVTFYPQAQELEPDQLLRQADQAMYQAKQAGKSRFHVFDAEQDRNVRARHESMQSIERALSEGEFVLEYQPKVNLRTGAVLGVEALIRWRHPQKGLVPPADFLPMIEDHPLAVKLGQWVIESALAQIESWREVGLNMAVSINIGRRHLMQADFVQRLREALAAHPAVRPGCLELELLEGSTTDDLARVSKVIQECRTIGVECALDDFGSGHSSLTGLKKLPVKYLKIEQNFIRDMLDSSDNLLILIGVLKLASAFDLKVIAEGVETAQHGSMLLELGCELGQGYGIAHPMPGAELPDWVRDWKPDPTWGDVQRSYQGSS